MNDYLLRATAGDGAIRAFFAIMRHTVHTAAETHQTTPVMSAALGRLLTAGAMMGLMLKNEGDLITLSIQCEGEAGGLLVTADHCGHVKGYANRPSANAPNKQNGKLNVSGVLGEGTLTVIRDMGFREFKEPYVGKVKLQTGEIAEDIAYYFTQSEQTPSAVALGVLVNADRSVRQAGGFMIQLLPGASGEIAEDIEKKVERLGPITSFYEAGGTPESLAEALLSDIGYQITDKIPASFYCNCSHERVEKALVSIGREEIREILEEDGSASLSCHFCNREYIFDASDLTRLLETI